MTLYELKKLPILDGINWSVVDIAICIDAKFLHNVFYNWYDVYCKDVLHKNDIDLMYNFYNENVNNSDIHKEVFETLNSKYIWFSKIFNAKYRYGLVNTFKFVYDDFDVLEMNNDYFERLTVVLQYRY